MKYGYREEKDSKENCGRLVKEYVRRGKNFQRNRRGDDYAGGKEEGQVKVKDHRRVTLLSTAYKIYASMLNWRIG